MRTSLFVASLLAVAPGTRSAVAQVSDTAPTKLARVLPSPILSRVLARIADARAQGLPATTLELRALELSAKGVAPDQLAFAIDQQAISLESGRQTLLAAGRDQPSDDEVAAAGTALRGGVEGRALSELAQAAPAGRPLSVPLVVIASLVNRGLPSNEAVRRVLARLERRASDRQLEALATAQAQSGDQPPVRAQDLAATRRLTDFGRPDVVPTTALVGVRPQAPPRPGHTKP